MALHGPERARELSYLVAAGMTPEQALRAATGTSAALMGWAGQVGSLAPGTRCAERRRGPRRPARRREGPRGRVVVVLRRGQDRSGRSRRPAHTPEVDSLLTTECAKVPGRMRAALALAIASACAVRVRRRATAGRVPREPRGAGGRPRPGALRVRVGLADERVAHGGVAPRRPPVRRPVARRLPRGLRAPGRPRTRPAAAPPGDRPPRRRCPPPTALSFQLFVREGAEEVEGEALPASGTSCSTSATASRPPTTSPTPSPSARPADYEAWLRRLRALPAYCLEQAAATRCARGPASASSSRGSR